MILKDFLYQSITFSIMIFINHNLIKYLTDIYIYSFWSMISLWILADSHIISMDMKYLEDKYKELDIRHKQLSIDYLDLVKNRHNEFNLICETIKQHSTIINDCRNQLLEIKNDMKLYRKKSYNSTNSSPNFSVMNSTPEGSPPPLSNENDKHLQIKTKERLNII